MVARLSCALCFLLGVLPARAELDLTPAPGTYTVEGITIKNVVFHDGKTEITYTPPLGWSISGGRAGVTMTPAKRHQATASIQSSARPRVTFDEKGQQSLKENTALFGLPKGAENVAVTSVIANPLQINGHATLEAQVAYSFYGQKCARSLLLVDRGGMEVSFVLDCLAADFKDLHEQFRRSWYSMENL